MKEDLDQRVSNHKRLMFGVRLPQAARLEERARVREGYAPGAHNRVFDPTNPSHVARALNLYEEFNRLDENATVDSDQRRNYVATFLSRSNLHATPKSLLGVEQVYRKDIERGHTGTDRPYGASNNYE